MRGFFESPPGRFGEVIAQHRNSEGELATVERVWRGEHANQLLLCLYDEATPTVAPMLLDEGTADWLWNFLATAECRTTKDTG
jgi:hypothetical protein